MTVDVIQRGEALAIFERDLIIHSTDIKSGLHLEISACRSILCSPDMLHKVDQTSRGTHPILMSHGQMPA